MMKETEELLQLMERASGIESADIISRKRQRPLPALRWFIGADLMALGYSSVMAARELNIDHATLLHGRKQIEDITDRKGWKVEVRIYMKFRKLVDEYRQTGTVGFLM